MLVDLPLVTRVEQSAAVLTAAQIDALAIRAPTSGAVCSPADSGVLASMGAGRYVNRGIGVGLGGTDPADLVDHVEAFYRARGLAPMLEVSPWVPTALVEQLAARGYTVQWFRNVYVHTLGDLPERSSLAVHEVRDHLVGPWSSILAADTDPDTPARAVAVEFADAMHHVVGSVDLVALVDDVPVATGSLSGAANIGWLGGAATLMSARGQGAQRALLVDRLHRAREAGYTLAAATAVPRGVSARNLQRVGFQLLHSQAVMALPA